MCIIPGHGKRCLVQRQLLVLSQWLWGYDEGWGYEITPHPHLLAAHRGHQLPLKPGTVEYVWQAELSFAQLCLAISHLTLARRVHFSRHRLEVSNGYHCDINGNFRTCSVWQKTATKGKLQSLIYFYLLHFLCLFFSYLNKDQVEKAVETMVIRFTSYFYFLATTPQLEI